MGLLAIALLSTLRNLNNWLREPAHAIALGLCLAPLVSLVIYVNSYARNVPVSEDWNELLDIAFAVHNDSLDYNDLVGEYWGHRPIVTNITTVVLAYVTDWHVILTPYWMIGLAVMRFALAVLIFREHFPARTWLFFAACLPADLCALSTLCMVERRFFGMALRIPVHVGGSTGTQAIPCRLASVGGGGATGGVGDVFTGRRHRDLASAVDDTVDVWLPTLDSPRLLDHGDDCSLCLLCTGQQCKRRWGYSRIELRSREFS